MKKRLLTGKQVRKVRKINKTRGGGVFNGADIKIRSPQSPLKFARYSHGLALYGEKGAPYSSYRAHITGQEEGS